MEILSPAKYAEKVARDDAAAAAKDAAANAAAAAADMLASLVRGIGDRPSHRSRTRVCFCVFAPPEHNPPPTQNGEINTLAASVKALASKIKKNAKTIGNDEADDAIDTLLDKVSRNRWSLSDSLSARNRHPNGNRWSLRPDSLSARNQRLNGCTQTLRRIYMAAQNQHLNGNKRSPRPGSELNESKCAMVCPARTNSRAFTRFLIWPDTFQVTKACA